MHLWGKKKMSFCCCILFVHLTSRSYSGNFFFVSMSWVCSHGSCPGGSDDHLSLGCQTWGSKLGVSWGGFSAPDTFWGCTGCTSLTRPWHSGQRAAQGSCLVQPMEIWPWTPLSTHHGSRNPVLRWVSLVMAWYRTILFPLAECVHKLLSALV